MQDALRIIKSTAEAMSHITAPPIATPNKTAEVNIPALDISFPPHLRPRFEELVTTSDVVSKLFCAFNKAALAAKALYNTQFEESCRQLLTTDCASGCLPLPKLFERLRDIYQSTYERSLQSWVDERIPLLMKHLDPNLSDSPTPRQSLRSKKSPFNHNYVPLMETYFNLNAFPSQADKSTLAKNSGMSYRQIDVWFQNRRSRARKDGNISGLRKLPSREHTKILSGILQGNHALSEKRDLNSAYSDPSEYEWQEVNDEDEVFWAPTIQLESETPNPLSAASPPHAFPSAYPPTCGYNPFSVIDGKRIFPPPVWMRHPAKSAQQRSIVDIDGLVEEFSTMNIRNGHRKLLVRRDTRRPTCSNLTRPPSSTYHSAATISTKPLPAPIPALIRPTRLASPSQPITLPFTPPPTTPPAGATAHNSPIRASVTNKLSHRKMAPLPQRKSTVGRRGALFTESPEHAVSSPITTPSISRQPSFRSDYSSETTSSDSSASSEPMTPESFAIPLPDSLASPAIAAQEFSGLFMFLGDPSSGRLSPLPEMLTLIDDQQVVAEKPQFGFTVGARLGRNTS